MSDVAEPDVRKRVEGLIEEPDNGPVKGADRAERYEGNKPVLLERFSTTAEYVVNMTTGRVHRRFRVGEGKRSGIADFPRCNLDQITHRENATSREEVAALFWPARPTPGRRTPVACRRCFPEPSAEDEAVADATEPIEEGEGTDPEAEQMPVEEMDPEDAAAFLESRE